MLGPFAEYCQSGVGLDYFSSVEVSCLPLQRATSTASSIKKNSWNRAVSDAEELVGYPTSLMSVRALMDDDFANIAVHMRKLIGSEHPVLHTVKRLVYQGKNKMQLRGLLMLLLSRAAGHEPGCEVDPATGIMEKQRKLAEIVEMINTGQAIHQSVVNLPVNIASEPDEDIRSILLQLEYGNKISILGGDYLLANASTGLASLRIPKIVENVSIAIAEFTQAEFLGLQDPQVLHYEVSCVLIFLSFCSFQGRVIPSSDQLNIESWETRARLGTGSLLAAGCHGVMLLAGRDEETQTRARELGHSLALAIRAHDEKIMFTEDGGVTAAGASFSLATLPVLLHLQRDPELLEHIRGHSDDPSRVNFRRVHDAVSGGEAMTATSALCEQYVDRSLNILKQFGDNDATVAIEKIATSIV